MEVKECTFSDKDTFIKTDVNPTSPGTRVGNYIVDLRIKLESAKSDLDQCIGQYLPRIQAVDVVTTRSTNISQDDQSFYDFIRDEALHTLRQSFSHTRKIVQDLGKRINSLEQITVGIQVLHTGDPALCEKMIPYLEREHVLSLEGGTSFVFILPKLERAVRYSFHAASDTWVAYNANYEDFVLAYDIKVD